jgi:hypothetical protein
MSANIVLSQRINFPDGRRARVIAYDDDSIRFKVSDGGYALDEAFMRGNQETILRLIRVVRPAAD